MKRIFLSFFCFIVTFHAISQSSNSNGWIIEPKFEYAAAFSDGLGLVKEGGKYGYVNAKGEYVIKPQFDEARSFKNNYAAVGIRRNGQILWNFINKQGNKKLMSFNCLEVYDFNEGLAAFKDTNGKWGFIDTEGTIVIGEIYESTSSFIKGFALVKMGNVNAFIDTKGRLICSEKYKSKQYKSMKESHDATLAEMNNAMPEAFPMAINGLWGYQGRSLKGYINANIESWDVYSSKRMPTLESYEQYIKPRIESAINTWQKKGEFERTDDWKARVNETTRQQKINELTSTFKAEYEKKLSEHKTQYATLAEEYKKELENLQKKYYQTLTENKEKEFAKSSFDLMAYDADNQSFLIKSDKQGDILISVPIDEAPDFKQKWNVIKKTITPVFVPSGEEVVLTSVVVTNEKKKYTYDSNTQAKYALTDINYNFDPIEISVPDVADVNYTFDPVEVIQSSIVQTSPAVKGLQANHHPIERKSISANKQSDVDINIPQNAENKGSTTFAVIIANENYQRVSPVEFAVNDGKLFAEYCQKTLGLPKSHVMLYTNATLGNMLGAINHIKEVGEAYNGKANIIFYYAGHGIPDEVSKDAYLLPIDGDGSSTRTCYKQSELYSELASIKAQSVVVFMDACFSGSQRGDGMLVAARGVAIKAKKTSPVGNMVVFSAAQGDETAYPFKEQKHGMFTYYLLKKLQESKGNVSLGELGDYITTQVKQQSIVVNRKSQTPTVVPSSAMSGEWRGWKLK